MKTAGRPKKIRNIQQSPKVIQFSPRGRPGRPGEISLDADEFEAIRLIDLSKLLQVFAAKAMGVSRQTFGRILRSARSKVADSLINGKIIRISGQNNALPQKNNLIKPV